MILKYLKFTVIIFLFTFVLFPQEKIKTEANSDLILYTNKEGLPTTSISDLVQTKDGYIWTPGIAK